MARMKATLALEYIGESQDALLKMYSMIIDQVKPGLGRRVVGNARPRKPWVARIVGRDPKYGWTREFLRANWQRKRANSTHSRGVELWFVLDSGNVYEVKSPTSWRSSDRYFCIVNGEGDIQRIAESVIEQWLKNH